MWILLLAGMVFGGGVWFLRLRLHIYRISNVSMEPTLRPGHSALVDAFAYSFHEPVRGELMVFDHAGIQDPTGRLPASIFILRVVGLPGETVRLVDGKIHIDGREQPAPELAALRYVDVGRAKYHLAEGITVPAGSYFTLGDNTVNCFDGRFWGFVPRSLLRGRVNAILGRPSSPTVARPSSTPPNPHPAK